MAKAVVFASVSTDDVLKALDITYDSLDASAAFVKAFPKELFPEVYAKANAIAGKLQVYDDPAFGVLGSVAITATFLCAVCELTAKVNELQARVDMNSKNSNKPPSTDGYQKPNSKGSEDSKDTEICPGADSCANEEDKSQDNGGSGNRKDGNQDTDNGERKGDSNAETEEDYQARTNRVRSLRNLIDPENAKDGTNYQCGCLLPEDAVLLDQVDYWPEKCQHCPRFQECKENSFDVLTRHVIDVKVTVTVQDHVAHAMHCPEDEDVVAAASFPEDVRSSIQYGIYIQALVIIFTCFGFMSWEKAREVMATILGRSFGKGNVQSFIHKLAEKLKPTIELIKNALWVSMVVGADETGYRVNGKLAWVHIACNAFFTYVFASAQRGADGMHEAGFLDYYENTLMTDCWKSYLDGEFNFINGLCNAHALRELFGIAMFMEKNSEWATKLMILLLEMNNKRNELKNAGKTEFSAAEKEAFYREWDNIIAEALELNPEKKTADGKRTAQGKVRCLLERLIEYRDGFCMFVEDFDIPFTNNISESGLRPVSCKSSVSYCFQTWEGTRDFMIIWSYLSSCRKHQLPMLGAILAGLNGTSAEFLFGENIPQRPEHVQQAMDREAAEDKRIIDILERAGFEGFVPWKAGEQKVSDDAEDEFELDKLLIDKLILRAEKCGASYVEYEGIKRPVEELKEIRENQVQKSRDDKQAQHEASEAKRKEREEKKKKPYRERLKDLGAKVKEELEKHKAKKKKNMSKTTQAVMDEVEAM